MYSFCALCSLFFCSHIRALETHDWRCRWETWAQPEQVRDVHESYWYDLWVFS